ncbi:U3 small nucleolar RNA-associated protein 18 homolog [Octopus sinensis]|uniref:U3 small nucleolar RNA-associated protein 18 homolog n=1 Tax=Octopus sinensis TaxID=2607531 RepID=A0A6P7TK27_9MOLL|nr:U3 small nucleolar RNA-associated protein 18 homolog [Octopus sinensis]
MEKEEEITQTVVDDQLDKPKSHKLSKSRYKAEKRKNKTVRHLEHVVFGDESLVVDQIEKNFQPKKKSKKHKVAENDVPATRKAAWEDLDDEAEYENNVTVVRASHQLSLETPKWAKLKNSEKRKRSSKQTSDSDDDENLDDNRIGLLQSTGNYLSKSSSLSSITIQLKKCTDANRDNPSQYLTASEFHPKSTVLMTAGRKCRFNLFQIDGERNRKIHTIFVDRLPIKHSHFSRDGLQIVLSSGYNYFSYFDMESAKLIRVPRFNSLDNNQLSDFILSPDGRYIVFLGQYGYMHLVSSNSKEYLTSLKMNGSVDAAAFSKDGDRMFSFGSDGQVYVWDMNSRCCIHRFYDDGCVNGTAVSVSPNYKYLACGSDSGVVNIYDVDTCMASLTPRPQKAIMNLTTECDSLLFNHSNEFLAATSIHSETGVKLIHLPSMTVFRNFPDSLDTDVTYPRHLDISPNSGYLTIGNNKGQALLYRIKHFGNY